MHCSLLTGWVVLYWVTELLWAEKMAAEGVKKNWCFFFFKRWLQNVSITQIRKTWWVDAISSRQCQHLSIGNKSKQQSDDLLSHTKGYVVRVNSLPVKQLIKTFLCEFSWEIARAFCSGKPTPLKLSGQIKTLPEEKRTHAIASLTRDPFSWKV